MFSLIVAFSFFGVLLFSMGGAVLLAIVHRRYELPRSVVRLCLVPMGLAAGAFVVRFHGELGLFAWSFGALCVLPLLHGLKAAWDLRNAFPLRLRTTPIVPADNE